MVEFGVNEAFSRTNQIIPIYVYVKRCYELKFRHMFILRCLKTLKYFKIKNVHNNMLDKKPRWP